MSGRKRGVFDGGETFIRFETLGAGVEIRFKRRAGPELAGGRAAERSDLAGSSAHDHAMAVVIILAGGICVHAGRIGGRMVRLARRSYAIRADDARLVETVDELSVWTEIVARVILIIFFVVHFFNLLNRIS